MSRKKTNAKILQLKKVKNYIRKTFFLSLILIGLCIPFHETILEAPWYFPAILFGIGYFSACEWMFLYGLIGFLENKIDLPSEDHGFDIQLKNNKAKTWAVLVMVFSGFMNLFLIFAIIWMFFFSG